MIMLEWSKWPKRQLHEAGGLVCEGRRNTPTPFKRHIAIARHMFAPSTEAGLFHALIYDPRRWPPVLPRCHENAHPPGEAASGFLKTTPCIFGVVMEKCGAKTRSGEPCKSWPVHGAERCRMHGGVLSGAPEGNVNAVTHGAYADLAADQINDSVFGAITAEPTLEVEMRIARYKLLRLLEPEILQNIVGGQGVETVKADEFAKVTGITALVSEIRKLAKEMHQTGVDDPLKELVDDWRAGMESEGKIPHEVGSSSPPE